MHSDASIQFSSVPYYIFYDKIGLQQRIEKRSRTMQIKSELIVFLCCHMTIVYSLFPVTFHDTCFPAHFVAKIDQLRWWALIEKTIEKREQLQWKSLSFLKRFDKIACVCCRVVLVVVIAVFVNFVWW